MKKQVIISILSILLIGFMSSCSKDINSDNISNSESGKLKLTLTDAPFPTDVVSEANITIDKIDVRQVMGSSEKFITLLSTPVSFNLLNLTNGVTEQLANISVPTGTFDLLRIVVSEASVTLKNGMVYDIKIPSGAQSGIKIFIQPGLEIAGGLTSELILDVDASHSFVIQGNPTTPAGIKGITFLPVIKVSNASTSGRIAGIVTDDQMVPVPGATITLFSDGNVVTTTIADDTGKFMLIGVLAGTYSLQAEKIGLTTTTVDNVEVVAANITMQNIIMN